MDQEKLGLTKNSKKKPVKSQSSEDKKQIKSSSDQNDKATSEKEVKAKSFEKKSPNKGTSEIKDKKESEPKSFIDKDVSAIQEKTIDDKANEQTSKDIIKQLEEEKTHIEDVVAIHAKDGTVEEHKGLMTSLKALKIKQKIILGVVATAVLIGIIIGVVAIIIGSLNKSFILNVQSDMGEVIEVKFNRDGSYSLSNDFGLEGYTFQGFFADPYFNEVITSVNKDTKVYAKWVINQYTATFIDSNGTVLGESTVDYLSDAEAPSITEREGNEFIRWDTDFTSNKNDITLIAQWQANE